MENSDKPAYPTNARMHSDAMGLTKKELFAMAAMQGILSGVYSSKEAYNSLSETAAKYGYCIDSFIVNKSIDLADDLLIKTSK